MLSEYWENKGQRWAKNNFMSSCNNRIAVVNSLFVLICSQPRDKQNRAQHFLLFKYFLNNLLLTVLRMRFQNSPNSSKQNKKNKQK